MSDPTINATTGITILCHEPLRFVNEVIRCTIAALQRLPYILAGGLKTHKSKRWIIQRCHTHNRHVEKTVPMDSGIVPDHRPVAHLNNEFESAWSFAITAGLLTTGTPLEDGGKDKPVEFSVRKRAPNVFISRSNAFFFSSNVLCSCFVDSMAVWLDQKHIRTGYPVT